MRFLYYSTSYYANHGGSIQSIEFYKSLDDIKSIDEKFIFPEKGGGENYNGKFRNLLRSFLRKIPWLQVLLFYRRNNFHLKGLKNKIREINPDVLFIQIDSNFLQIKRIKESFPNLLICTQVNGSPFDEPFKNIGQKKKFLKIQRNSYELTDLNIFISDFSRRRIMGKSLNKARDKVIHNGTNTDKFYPILNKQSLRSKMGYPNKFNIGYLGTLDFHKQLLILIEVFYDLKQKYPDLRLIIIGDGPAYSKIREKVKQYQLEEFVELKGWIKHDEINDHINCFDVAVHHYANNYMNPLKVFEYLAAGLPVLAPDIPSVREAFKDGVDLIITGSSKEEILENLEALIINRQLRERLSQNQHLIKKIAENYTWKRYSERIVNQIETLRS
ncbi:glycosyltransferase family 4 protein [Zunongwangia sp. H14]|uniref:glycosyltransferase family 4 protein n=1 Tax=Zunongwangia sp. H14 TaxID=3240792 RepID=UPI003562BB7B